MFGLFFSLILALPEHTAHLPNSKKTCLHFWMLIYHAHKLIFNISFIQDICPLIDLQWMPKRVSHTVLSFDIWHILFKRMIRFDSILFLRFRCFIIRKTPAPSQEEGGSRSTEWTNNVWPNGNKQVFSHTSNSDDNILLFVTPFCLSLCMCVLNGNTCNNSSIFCAMKYDIIGYNLSSSIRSTSTNNICELFQNRHELFTNLIPFRNPIAFRLKCA